MREHQIRGRLARVTQRRPALKAFRVAGENLLQGHPDVSQVNQAWVGDVTYLKVKQRWIYLAAIMDLYSRRILGWSLSRTRTTQLTLTAFKHAVRHRGGERPAIFHTDRGMEYTAYRYQDRLERLDIRQSLNRPGQCTDNAHMESFFHSLKTELIRGRRFETESQLRLALNSYINQFYNHKRLHSAIGYMSPAAYEEMAA